jgi:hypothetical protein
MAREQRPEIVIILNGLNLDFRDIRNLKTTGAWVVNINHDDFFSHNRNNWSWLDQQACSFLPGLFGLQLLYIAKPEAGGW